MNKIFLTDGSGRWFDADQASTQAKEDKPNELLYRTRKGAFIFRNQIKDRPGYTQVSEATAMAWVFGHWSEESGQDSNEV